MKLRSQSTIGVYMMCKNETLMVGFVSVIWTKIHQWQTAGAAENPLGFMDCQRHRSSPAWETKHKDQDTTEELVNKKILHKMQSGSPYTFFPGQNGPSSPAPSQLDGGRRSRMLCLLLDAGRFCMRSIEEDVVIVS